MGARLLDGLRVLDAGVWRPVPHATQMLADLGAEVLKIEPPTGDPMRHQPEAFAAVNGDKRSIVLDLKHPADQARALELAAEAHVFTEGFRPGVADRLGIGFEAIRAVNPAIVYCSISGYGQTGDYTDLAGHDLNYQAMAGYLYRLEDGTPVPPAHADADLLAGTVAAFVILAAWHRARTTGEAEYLDVAMADVLVPWVGPFAGGRPGSDGRFTDYPAYGLFATADGGWLSLGVTTEDHFWRAVCTILEMADVADLEFDARRARAAELKERVAQGVARLARDDAFARLRAAGAAVAPVLERADILASDHFKGRGVVTQDWEGRTVMGFPARFSNTASRPPGKPPALDADRERGFGAGA